MARILIVDDDTHIREVVHFALTQAGHHVVEAKGGREALARFSSETLDLVVLDILMPDLDGIEVCRELRRSSRVPIVFLSSRDEELDRILGLELGADDYLTKPFSPRELVARVKAVLRRTTASVDLPPALLHRGGITLDASRHQCFVGQIEITLTVTEFALVRTLMGVAGKVYSRGELVDLAWGDDLHITERTIDSHIRRLRRKFADLDADPIETVYGVGYRLRE